MNRTHFCLVAVAAMGLFGCGVSPDEICAAEEAVQAISTEAKENSALYFDVLTGTDEPPYKKNEAWITQFNDILSLKKKSEGVSEKLNEAVATCIAMDETSTQKMEFGGNSRARMESGDAAGAIAGFGVGLVVALVKPSIDAMSPTEKREKIWTPMCNGDFSSLHKEHQHGTAMADILFPARYAFWNNTVEKLQGESSRINQSIAAAEVILLDYETKIYSVDYEKVKFELKDISLVNKNEDETSFQCSANVTANVDGYASASKNLNYSVLLTTEGKRKVSITKDSDYNTLFVTGGR